MCKKAAAASQTQRIGKMAKKKQQLLISRGAFDHHMSYLICIRMSYSVSSFFPNFNLSCDIEYRFEKVLVTQNIELRKLSFRMHAASALDLFKFLFLLPDRSIR